MTPSIIDRSSPIPIYYQIAMDLRHRITQGEWSVDGQLPPEAELAAQYQVSRMTLRQALAHLDNDGILIRQRGSGTFIAQYPNHVVPTLNFPISFTHQIQELGITPTTRILSAEILPVMTPEIAAHLGLSEEAEIARFRRIFDIAKQPVAISTSILPYQLCPGITEMHLVNDSLSDTLAQQYGLHPSQVDQWLAAIRAGQEEAELLKIQPDSPLLCITTLIHLANGTPIEYAVTYCVGERLRLHFHAVSGKEDAPASAFMETIKM